MALVAAAAAGARAYDTGQEYELRWDNGGLWGYTTFGPSGAGCWYGNDFDAATLGTAVTVNSIKWAGAPWPNTIWEGQRFALFAFAGAPGSMLWPTSGVPKYAVGTGSGWGWFTLDVGWRLAAGTTAFLAAAEQYYNYPNCDGFLMDNNPTFQGHTWVKMPGYPWNRRWANPRNYMMRAIVAVGYSGVAPASLGRVRALYH